jgi:hypothetical protein
MRLGRNPYKSGKQVDKEGKVIVKGKPLIKEKK